MFGHRNGSEWFGHFSGVLGGYQNPPGEVKGLMGHKKEAHQTTRGWCAPPWAGGRIEIGLGGGPPFLLSYSSFPVGVGL